MTITVTPRRTAAAVITAIALAAFYLLGSARAGASVASAAGTGGPSVAIAPAASGSGVAASTGPAIGVATTPGGITVTGTGTVSGTPDTIRVDFGVDVTSGSVSSALASANATTAHVQDSLTRRGVAAKDMQTSGLSIQPSYSYSASGQPTVKGYQVTEGLSVLLRDLGSAGATINAAVAAGGNAVRVDGVGLDLSDTSSLMAAARSSAFSAAKAKADQYARAAGRSLGQAVSISEVVANPTPVYGGYPAASGTMAGAAPVPVQAGTQDVSVTVTVVFAFA